MKTLCTILSAAALIIPAYSAEGWHTDFAAAQAQAQAENKPIVLDFTGSDWCGWCITMRRQVLDTPAFYDFARDKFVLMEVDLPRNTSKLTQQQLQQNNELVRRYGVDTFPTVMVISPRGQLLGGFAGGRTELPYVTAPLEQAAANAALLQQAETQSGTEKARTLYQFYHNLPGRFRRNMPELLRQIAELDPQNTTGARTELQDITIVRSITDQTQHMGDDAAIPAIIEALPKVTNAHRNKLVELLSERLNHRIQQRRETARNATELEAMRSDMLTLVRYCVAKENQRTATDRINAMFHNPQDLLEELRREQEYRLKYKK